MNRNYVYSNVNEALPGLMWELLTYGHEFGSRAGKTMELNFVGITLERPWQREITAPDRKANVAAQIAETMWVLSGRNDVAGLSHYLPRAIDFSDDGKTWRAGYGPRLRNYRGVDQIHYIVETLRANPSSRQAVCTIWDPTVDTMPGKDIACNNWLTFSARDGKLDLMVGIRSNDAMWGWSGINAFEWSALLEIVADMTGLAVGHLHFATTSFHLYEQHWEKAHRLAKADAYLYDACEDSPRYDSVKMGGTMAEFDDLAREWFALENRIRTGDPCVAEVERFAEPMLRSWLRVLQWYWSGNEDYLVPLAGTRLARACLVGLKPAGEPQEPQEHVEQLDLLKPNMVEHINKLHAEKHAAYGDSWKKRGEAGILANIARKVDRIGSGVDTTDETQADTAQDLLVYLAKYRCWLQGGQGDPEEVAALLDKFDGFIGDEGPFDFDSRLDQLFAMTGKGDQSTRMVLVNEMLEHAYTLALSLW